MKKWIPAVSLAVMAAWAPAQADWRDMQIQRTVNNISALQSYQGVIEQKGVYGEETVVAKIVFRRPHDFASEVTAPAPLQGAVTRYTGNELLTWLPSAELAIRIRHLPPAPEGLEPERIADAWRENNRRNFYALGPVKTVAGHDTIELEQRSRDSDALILGGTSYIYDNFSFPLAGTLNLAGDNVLEYRYREIEFNREVTLPPAPALPPQTMLIEWDLQWPDASSEMVNARVPAASLPGDVLGMPARRKLVHPGALPAVAIYYTDDNYFFLLTASRDFGVTLPGAEYGMAVPLNRDLEARALLSPVVNNWSFSTGDVAYTVMTNQHPEKVYEWLREREW